MSLEVFNKDNLTKDESEFISKHNSLIKHANDTAFHLYLFCKTLNEIKVSKIYKQGGLSSFEEYSENVLGLKKSQAYNYCTIAEKINPEIFQLIGKNPSSTKLVLLANLTHEEQLEVVSNFNDKTVVDLKKEIEELKTKNNDLSLKLSDYNSKENQIIELETELHSLKYKPVIESDTPLYDEIDGLLKEHTLNKEKFRVLFDILKSNIKSANDLLLTFDIDDRVRYKEVLKGLFNLIG